MTRLAASLSVAFLRVYIPETVLTINWLPFTFNGEFITYGET